MFGITTFAQSPFAALGVATYNQTVSESIAVSEAQTNVLLQNDAVVESTVITDIQSVPGAPELVAESIALSDAYSLSNNIFNALVSESTTPSDTDSSTGVIFSEEVDEVNGISDSIAAAQTHITDVAESVTTSDAFTGERVFNYFISESVSAADVQDGVFNFVAMVAESVSPADNVTFTVDTRALPTGVLITISVTNVNVWGNIDDASNPNWVIIND